MKVENIRVTGGQARNSPLSRRFSVGFHAYTLIEVLLAMVILTVISTAFYSALSSSFTLVQNTREDLRATQIMTQKLEALRLCRWDQLTNFSNFTFRENYDPLSTNASGTVFVGTVVTNAAAAIPDTAAYKPNMRLVSLTVSWTNYVGSAAIPHTRQMDAYVALYGIQNYIWGAGQ